MATKVTYPDEVILCANVQNGSKFDLEIFCVPKIAFIKIETSLNKFEQLMLLKCCSALILNHTKFQYQFLVIIQWFSHIERSKTYTLTVSLTANYISVVGWQSGFSIRRRGYFSDWRECTQWHCAWTIPLLTHWCLEDMAIILLLKCIFWLIW